ncbi:MAG TPA: hypothetical protein VGO89_13940 [Streptomyces sp.]|jgi:hypothetical protein|nr:hypothetical protein [Streptomyces sp.]
MYEPDEFAPLWMGATGMAAVRLDLSAVLLCVIGTVAFWILVVRYAPHPWGDRW